MPEYPLMEHAADTLHAASGRPLAEVTLDAVAAGELSIADLQIHASALREQAHIAHAAGYRELATNLTRAAELTAVPNEELLRMYELLRPGRSSYAELLALAETLEQRYDAPENGRLVREAAQVYRERNMVKREAGEKGE